MLRVSEIPELDIKVGLRIRSLKDSNKLGTIVQIDDFDDRYSWVQWDGDDKPTSGFYGNCCKCEVVE